MKLSFQWSIVILVLAIGAAGQSERYVRPVDEGKTDRSFRCFRADLISALKERNTDVLYSVLDPRILNSFGGNGGIEEFKSMWKPEEENSRVWEELLAALENGGTFMDDGSGSERRFCAPYLFAEFPDELDAFEQLAAFYPGVKVYSKPNLFSDTVATLEYNVVSVDFENSVTSPDDENEWLWAKIRTLGGISGFVDADSLRSPLDYRACFERSGDRWLMSIFVAGD